MSKSEVIKRSDCIEVRISEISILDEDRNPNLRDILHKKYDEGMDKGYFYSVLEWFDWDEMQTVVQFYPTDKCPDDYISKELIP